MLETYKMFNQAQLESNVGQLSTVAVWKPCRGAMMLVLEGAMSLPSLAGNVEGRARRYRRRGVQEGLKRPK